MMTFITCVVLLAILLTGSYSEYCPKQCKCVDENVAYSCNMKNGTVSLEVDSAQGYYAPLIIKCESKDVSCSDFPQLDVLAGTVELYSCPPSVLRCVHEILDGPIIEQVDLYNVSDDLTREDVKRFIHVEFLRLDLAGDTLVPIAGLNSWRALKTVVITGGMLDVSSDSFNHLSLTILSFDNTKMKVTPDGEFKGLSNLETLYIQKSTVEEIHGGAFKGLDNLKELTIERCPLKLIEVQAFADTPKLEKLILGEHHLEYLPREVLENIKLLATVGYSCGRNNTYGEINLGNNAFANLSTLTGVYVEDCRLNALPEDLFTNSNAIIHIILKDNIIQNISSKIFLNTPHVETLNLKNNSLSVLSDGIFNYLTSLEYLDLSDNALSELPNDIFKSLTSLKLLDFAQNRLQTLPKMIFHTLTSLNYLNLDGNNIQELPNTIFVTLVSMKSLNLDNNGIVKLDKNIFSNMTLLESLNLANNKIMHLPELNNLKKLNTLDLSGNKFQHLSTDIFYGATELTEINLRNNRVTSMAYGSYDDKHYSPFEQQKKLVKLDLSGNRLRRFFDSWKIHLQQTRELNMSNNRLRDIKVFQGDYSNLKITIDLQHNNITKIVLDTRAPDSEDTSPATSQLLLDNNPINCDCNIYGLILRLKGARLPNEPQYILNNSTCYNPSNLRGNMLQNVSPMDLVCDLSKQRPDNCSTLVARVVPSELTLTCSKVPPSLLDLTADKLPYAVFESPTIALNLDEQPRSIDHININKLNISNAGIHSVTFKPIKSLSVLDLSHNNLITLPDEFLDANVTFYLAGNPLKCDCTLARKLKKRNVLADSELVYCENEGKNFTEIDDDEICNRANALTSFIGTTAVCGLFLSIIFVAMCKYVKRNWTSIVYNLFGNKTKSIVQLEEIDVSKRKRFDLFISFAPQDEEFVRGNLLSKLECELFFKACVNFRDCNVNDSVPEQIRQSVNNSARTVIIVSEDYLKSEWLVTFNKVQQRYNIEQSETNIIIILLNKDIINDERVSDDLISYITVNPYLLWGDPDFWQKFTTMLPKQDQR